MPTIYVACLASYNNGTLYGTRIDASQSADEIQAAIDAMLAKSPTQGAEEWAIHDYDGFGKANLGENPDLETVAKLAELIEKHGAPFEAYAAYHSSDLDYAIERFEEAYRGTYKSVADYAAEFSEETGMEIPEHLANYIDWEAMGRDWVLGGDILAIEDDYKTVYIFDNHV